MELRTKGISDLKVLSAIERTPRDLFVMETFQDRAWDDIALPIKDGQTISQPFVVAYMTAALELGNRMRIGLSSRNSFWPVPHGLFGRTKC